MAAPSTAWESEFAIRESAEMFELCGNCAVVDVCGPLEQHAGGLSDSYDAIRARCTAAFASEAETVVLRINSPGGDFAGSIELARELSAMSDDSGKRLVAYTDSQALSAGYILACAAEEIAITSSAFVGSIGVWAALVDETRRDGAMGINVVIVPSGTRKTDGNPHVAVTPDAVSALQVQVDAMASLFFGLVVDRRVAMGLGDVESLQGSQQFGAKALSLGLADRIVDSWGAFLSSLDVNYKESSPMAKSYEEAKKASRKALEACAAGDDEDAKKAKTLLAKFDEDGDAEPKAEDMTDEDKKKKEDADAAAAKAADDEDAKARAADEETDTKAAARAAASSNAEKLDLVARVHALETSIKNAAEASERSSLLGTRPDFSATVRASLQSAPLSFVKDACKNWPRGSTPEKASASATVPGGTRGDTQANGKQQTFNVTEEDFIAKHMNGQSAGNGVVREGSSMTLGFMTPSEVAEAAKKLASKGGK